MRLTPDERGVVQRNEAIRWLRKNFQVGAAGVVYFAEDHNTYSVELFSEISKTKKVSVFPVGLVGGLMLERPTVSRTEELDIAGFAVNLGHLLSHTSASFVSETENGYQETEFLKQLIKLEELEPVATNKVLVWHTNTNTEH